MFLDRSIRDINFLYPYGATLNVVQPSVVALSSGSIAIPMNRPICAYYSGKNGSGKLVVLGSARMFTDPYIEREKNSALQEMIFDFFDSNDTAEKDFQSDDVDVSPQKIKDSRSMTLRFMTLRLWGIMNFLVLGVQLCTRYNATSGQSKSLYARSRQYRGSARIYEIV